jgi:hypothetical protein
MKRYLCLLLFIAGCQRPVTTQPVKPESEAKVKRFAAVAPELVVTFIPQGDMNMD